MGGWVNLLNCRLSVCSLGIIVCSFFGIFLSERFVNVSFVIFDFIFVILESVFNIVRVKLLLSDKVFKFIRF